MNTSHSGIANANGDGCPSRVTWVDASSEWYFASIGCYVASRVYD